MKPNQVVRSEYYRTGILCPGEGRRRCTIPLSCRDSSDRIIRMSTDTRRLPRTLSSTFDSFACPEQAAVQRSRKTMPDSRRSHSLGPSVAFCFCSAHGVARHSLGFIHSCAVRHFGCAPIPWHVVRNLVNGSTLLFVSEGFPGGGGGPKSRISSV
jgi:hypothetical protein